MSPQSHSYGTGTRPEQIPSRLPVILVALFLLTQLIFVLYLCGEETATPLTESSENLAEILEQTPVSNQRCTDSCGLGLELSGLSEAQQRYWSLPAGVFVEAVFDNGNAFSAGLRVGDILVSINDEPTPDIETARRLLSSVTCDTLRLSYYRDQQTITVTIPIAK